MMNIYVGSYKGYNDGILDGKWISLPCDDVWDEIEESCVPGAEEFGLFDFESDFMDYPGELANIDELNDIAEQLQDLDDYQKEILNALTDDGFSISEAIDKLDDCIFYENMDMADIAFSLYEDCGMMDSDNPLYNYIDWDAVGRDMSFDGHYINTAVSSLASSSFTQNIKILCISKCSVSACIFRLLKNSDIY